MSSFSNSEVETECNYKQSFGGIYKICGLQELKFVRDCDTQSTAALRRKAQMKRQWEAAIHRYPDLHPFLLVIDYLFRSLFLIQAHFFLRNYSSKNNDKFGLPRDFWTWGLDRVKWAASGSTMTRGEVKSRNLCLNDGICIIGFNACKSFMSLFWH